LRPAENLSQNRLSGDDKPFLVGPCPEDLCLGFVNTLSWRGRLEPVETLHSSADLFNWIERSEILPRASIAEARNWASDHEKRAAQGFAKAIAVREALFAIFSAIAADAGVTRKNFQIVEAALAVARIAPDLSRRRTVMLGPDRPSGSRSTKSWLRSFGPLGTCWCAQKTGESAAAQITSACGCLSIRAKPTAGGGAICSPAGTAPRRSGITREADNRRVMRRGGARETTGRAVNGRPYDCPCPVV